MDDSEEDGLSTTLQEIQIWFLLPESKTARGRRDQTHQEPPPEGNSPICQNTGSGMY